MQRILDFVAGHWWVWLILTFGSYGLFLSNIGVGKEVDSISRNLDRRLSLEEKMRIGARMATQKGKQFAHTVPSDWPTKLAWGAIQIFMPLLFVSGVLKFFGY